MLYPDFLRRTACRVSHLFFYQPLAGWPRHDLWVSTFPPWLGTPLRWAPAVQCSLPSFAPSLFVLLFAAVCYVSSPTCLLWVLASRHKASDSYQVLRAREGGLSRRGLCFLIFSRQLTPAQVSGRAVWAREGGVKAKHGPPDLRFALPTHPVVSAVTFLVFSLFVLLSCSGALCSMTGAAE